MRTVHGFWSEQLGLCLWGEDSELSVTSPSQARRRARPHPFAVSADDLAGLHPGRPASAVLLLPSLLSSPLDSPELLRLSPRPDPRRDPVLSAWSVPVVCVDPATASHVLDEPADEVRYGESITFLGEVVAFARELAERGRVLPTIVEDAGSVWARWRPVLQGPDVVAFQSLITAMPPVCRAETTSPTDLDGPSPAHLVGQALDAMVDAAVRARFDGSFDSLPPRRGRPSAASTVAETWIRALTAGDGQFDATADEIDQVRDWLSPWSDIGLGAVGPARATFRLTDDPETGHSDEPVWRLEFLLQSLDDPSLLVPAEQVWMGGDGLARWLSRPDDLLLAELGRASTVYPELSDALRQARPDALDLGAEGVHDFLSVRAGLLDQAGFGVLVPSWWKRRRRLGLAARATTPQDGAVAAGGLSRDTLHEFEWQLAVGDDLLTEEEMAALAAAKAPLVRMRGEWVAVDPEQVRRGLEFLSEQREQPKTAAEILALAARHPDDLDTPLPVTSVDADGRLGEFLLGADALTLAPVEPPTDFDAALRPYQERGLSWLSFLSDLGLGACLADDMGLGKTVQLLALEAVERAARPSPGPTLLVCPMSLVGNWQREAAKFAPSLRTYAHHGPEREHGDALDGRLAQTDLVVTTYQTVVRDIDELAARRWERVVLDEAQAIKNRLSLASKAVRQLDAGHKVALTGTPMENRLAELWSIMDFLNPGMLGSPESFKTRYSIPVERHGETEPADLLRAITRPYVLRRVKTDKSIIDDLPDKIETKQYCRLTTEQASLYKSVVDEMMELIEESDGIERRGNVLATMAKLKQVCNHPAQLLHDRSPVGRRSGKVARLEEILDEILAEGGRALLFTQYTEFAELLLPHLSARYRQDVLYLHGGTPQKRRDEMVTRFQAGDASLFLLSLRAGGTGLNLTAANHVIHLDRWWNPAVENQATDRAFRIGQKQNVQVHKFICTGTLEERIDDMIEQKKELASLVVGDGEGWLTELSTADLRQVFALSEGAFDE